MTDRFTPTHLALMPDGSYELGGYLQPDEHSPYRHDPLDDMPTAWEVYGSRFDAFVENVANGHTIEESGVPLWAARVFWQRVLSDLGPQAV